jgi:hypothetical protein
MQQHRFVPSNTILPLRAPVTLDILMAVDKLRDNLTSTLASPPVLERFRALLAVFVNYTFYCRAEIGTRCLTCYLAVDRPSRQICLFVRKSKGDQCRNTARNKLAVAVPIPANPVLADLKDYYLNQRTTFCETYFKRPPHAAVWSVSSLEPSEE